MRKSIPYLKTIGLALLITAVLVNTAWSLTGRIFHVGYKTYNGVHRYWDGSDNYRDVGAPAMSSNFDFLWPNNNGSSGDIFIMSNASTGQTSLVTILPMANGDLGVALTDPGADTLLFWNDTTNEFEFLGIGAGLTISGGDLVNTNPGP